MKGIDSETKQDFANSIDVLLSHKTIKFVLVFKEDNFRRLFSFRFSFILHNFVVLCQLNFIGFDHLGNFRLGRLLEAREHLNEVDGDLEDAFGGCDNLFEFFGVVPEISVKVDFSSGQVSVLLEAEKPGDLNSFGEGFILFLLILG